MLLFSKKHGLKDAVVSIFAMVYPLAISMLLIVINHSYGGVLGIMLILFIAVLTDTFAFFTGKLLGKRKLCPEVSPKKTVAGAVGGVFGGVLGAMCVFLMDHFNVFHNVFAQSPNNTGTYEMFHIMYNGSQIGASIGIYIAAGIIGAVLCQLGDLTASYIKRKTGIKDFGHLFPGHGGVMDRLDGILFVLPVVYILIRAILLAAGQM
jgi:phosphatidate cytidylyltransferase